MASELKIVCMAMGDSYPDINVTRLYNMLRRNLDVPFQLVCIIDRPRQFPPEVATIDASGWTQMRREGMRVTTNKLRLFDEEAVPFPEFLYLDTTLVITKNLRPLLDYALGRPEDLVIVRDWNYDCYNSCVMRIRQSPALRQVYEAFVAGKEYPHQVPGDQDFIYAAIADFGHQDRVAFFREDDVVSYRNTRKLARKDRELAYEKLSRAIIVKFHGTPKMHQIVDPFYNFFRIRLRNPRYGASDATFWVKELREYWR